MTETHEDQFLAGADLAVAVLGLCEEFVLIDVIGANDRAEFYGTLAEAKTRGFMICGYLRASAGTPGVLCVNPAGVVTMTNAAMAWAAQNADYFRAHQSQSVPAQSGGTTDWLSRLHSLPDARPNYGPN